MSSRMKQDIKLQRQSDKLKYYDSHNIFLMKKDRLDEILSNNPTLIILGEAHTDYDHARIESDVITRFKPDYLLPEGFDSNEIKDFPLRFDPDLSITPKNLYSDQKAGLDEQFMHHLYSTYESLTGEMRNLRYFYGVDEAAGHSLDGFFINVKSFEEFLNKPLVLLPSIILEEIRKAAYKSNETSLETRQLLNRLIKKEKEIEESFSSNSFHWLFTASQVVPAARVYGIDLENNYDWLEREDNMGKVIAEISAKAASEGKKALAIVGAHHIREDSKIFSYLESTGVRYEKLALDHKDSITDYYYDVHYSEKIKNQDKNKQ